MREFTDGQGRRWRVWDVFPTHVERRAHRDAADPPVIERRVVDSPRAQVHPEFREGWLAFETARERRRLAPRPEGWHRLADEELEALCARARRVTSAKRMPIHSDSE